MRQKSEINPSTLTNDGNGLEDLKRGTDFRFFDIHSITVTLEVLIFIALSRSREAGVENKNTWRDP